MLRKISIKYNEQDPGMFWVGGYKNDLEVCHNHPEIYDTSYLYEKNYTPERAAQINNEINVNTAKLKGCMSFFKSLRESPTYPLSQVSARALAEDEVKLRSLTEKTFNP